MKLRNLLELLSHEPAETDVQVASLTLVKGEDLLHIALDTETGVLHLNRTKASDPVQIYGNTFKKTNTGIIV